MSSGSEEDLATYGPTTPFAPRQPTRKAKAKAGPSSKPPPKKTKSAPKPKPAQNSKKGRGKVVSESEVEEIIPEVPITHVMSDENDEPEDEQLSDAMDEDVEEGTPTKRKVITKGKGVPATNGKAKLRAAAESVQKIIPKTATNARNGSEVPKEITVSEHKRLMRSLEKTNERLQRANERLQKELEATKRDRDILVDQFEELGRIRNTEPETLLQHQSEQYEERLKTQDDLIKQLSGQLSKLEPLSRKGQGSVPTFLTREDADKEKSTIEKDLAKSKEAIALRDQRIRELEQLEKATRRELEQEVANSKQLVAKTAKVPGTPLGGGRGQPVVETREALAISIYEEITNLLLTSIRPKDSPYLSLKEREVSCVYTVEEAETNLPTSLSFHLRFFWEPADKDDVSTITDIAQLNEVIGYSPSPVGFDLKDYEAELDFLVRPFTFQRNQLPLFLRTMYSRMVGERQTEVDNITTVGDLTDAISVDSD